MNKHKIFSVFTLSITLGNLWSQPVIPVILLRNEYQIETIRSDNGT